MSRTWHSSKGQSLKMIKMMTMDPCDSTLVPKLKILILFMNALQNYKNQSYMMTVFGMKWIKY